MTPSHKDTVKRRSKFGNVKTVVDGVTFDSRREATRWGELKLLHRAGIIADLRRQVPYDLTVNGKLICKYIADFTYAIPGDPPELVTEDSKGVVTPEFRLKSKLMEAVHGVRVKLS